MGEHVTQTHPILQPLIFNILKFPRHLDLTTSTTKPSTTKLHFVQKRKLYKREDNDTMDLAIRE